MAESKKGFPMLPIAHWWNLRKKFRQSLPGVVTGSYLATVLNMAEKSANANILPFLKTLGIIDDDGKTTERAKLWRDDQHYPEVCSAILKDVYPTELLEAVTNPMEDREAAERWFARQSGSGEAAAGRMAALYSVLVEADATKQPDQEKRNAAKNTSRTPPKTPKTPLKPTTPLAQDPSGNPPSKDLPAAPGVHINLEIHISADASADQIDLIFAAMAKHIYKRV
jgi:hypothetical protein